MSNSRPQTMDAKQKRDQALNLADFKIDDISSVPGDQLLAEVAEEFGHPAFLAAAFDAIALPVLTSHDNNALTQGGAAATFSAPRATPGVAALPAVPLRHRVLTGACAALLLVAVLIPGIYPRLIDRSADRIATASKDGPSTPLPAPAPTPSQPPPVLDPAAPGSPSQSAAVPPAPLPELASRAPAPTEERKVQAPPPPPVPRAAAAPAPAPQSMAAAEPPAAPLARAQGPLQRQAIAKPRPTEGNGFVVQLSAAKSEAEAQSTFQALKSKYAVLKGREPMIRRKDQGNRGAFYALQVGPFESQGDAEQLCERLKAAGGSCFATRN
jgi:cell division septation protein DedD